MKNQTLGPDLDFFFMRKARNEWLHSDGMAVYVRKGYQFLDRELPPSNTLDVANINIKEEHRGKGWFTAWLKYAEEVAKEQGKDAVYVESVENVRLIPFLLKSGYSEVANLDGAPCFFKRCN